PNVVRWSDANEHLGSLAATTQKESRVVHGRLAIVRATTILNAALCWDAYDGPLQPTLWHGQLALRLDVRRVVLHELGHVLGLEHPDDGGQDVPAIMNHTTSNVETLQADDEAGIQALYPSQPGAAQPQNVHAPLTGGGHGGGCSRGTGDPDVVLLLLVMALLGQALRARIGPRRHS